MIPNALAILFYPLYTFGYQFDMLAVRTAEHGLFADLYVVSYQSSGYHGAFFNYDTGHEDAVNDLCAGADFSACKLDGVANLALNDTALGDKSLIDLGVRTYV